MKQLTLTLVGIECKNDKLKILNYETIKNNYYVIAF